MRSSWMLVTAFAVLAATACGPHPKTDPPPDPADDFSDIVADGTASAAAENDTESLTASLVAVSGSGLGPASFDGSLHTAGIGDVARGLYRPANCLTTTSDPATKSVTYAFDQCLLGPYGLAGITGKVTLRYESDGPNHLVLHLTATGLKANRAVVDWNADADITANGPKRTMLWKASLSGNTARGKPIARTNQKTVTWTVGETCVGLDGFSEGNLTGKRVRVDITSYRRCAGSCPEPGSAFKITNQENGKSVSVRYEANDAVYTDPNGKQTTFQPACRQ